MAIALKKRRVVTAIPEVTRGTFIAPNPTNDAINIIQDGSFSITPVSIERTTLRSTLTKVSDLYPGKATCEIKLTVELGGLPANPKTDYDVPNWFDLLRGCGFEEISNSNGGRKPRLLQNVTGLTGTDAAGTPIRHGQALVGNGVGPAGAGTAIGDFYPEDDVLCVLETTAPGTTPTPFTWTQTISGLTRIASGTHDAVGLPPRSVVAARLTSDVNFVGTPLPATGMGSVSMEIYNDGKRLQAKGCMGNVQILLDYGDMIRGEFTMQGVVVSPITTGYADVAMPATPFDLHKVAPTFLGKDIRVYEIAAAPKFYGRDTAAATPTVGSISTIRLNSGNDVILRKNAFDPDGVSFALITARNPSGSFDPDEVLNSEFDWVTKFVNGTPVRFKAMIGSAGTVTTQDGNTIDLLAPGIQVSQLGDADRDGINAWDGQFKIAGGDYDPSAAGEAPGADNELVIIYR